MAKARPRDTVSAAMRAVALPAVNILVVDDRAEDQLVVKSILEDPLYNLVTAQTNLVIARYQVLSAVGRLTAKDLALNVPIYDPTKHYNQVRDKIWGTGPSVE